MSAQLLKVENLKVLFESLNGFVHAVDDVSFTLNKGEVLGIIGESGSGKTVLLSSICGLVNGEPGIISGDIFFKENNLLHSLDEIINIKGNGGNLHIKKEEYDYQRLLEKIRMRLKGKISMIFQDPRKSLDPLFTIEEQMSEAIRSKDKNVSQSLIDEMVIDWLSRVQIDEPDSVMKKFPSELSGGMLQRVMIAVSMIMEPEVLIADEPTTALDVNTTVQILDLLQELNAENNSSMIFVTHDINLAKILTDKIIVMNSGRVVEFGKTNEVLNNSINHPYTEALLQARLNPFTTNTNTQVHFIKDRNYKELFYSEGCKFRYRCNLSDAICEGNLNLVRVSPDHWINCSKIRGSNV